MTTLQQVIDDCREYLQMTQFSGIGFRKMAQFINRACQELYPKIYSNFNIMQKIESPVPAGFSVSLPLECKVVTEVQLKPPGKANETEELKKTIRLTAYEIQIDEENRLKIVFNTCGWYGTLAVMGESVVQFNPDEPSKVYNIPSDEPIVHRVAYYYYNQLTNAALRDGDTQRYQALTNAAGRELQLSDYTASRVRMSRQIPRTSESIDMLRRAAAAKYNLSQNLPVK